MNFKAANPFVIALALVSFTYLVLKISLAQLDAMKTASYQAGFAAANAANSNAVNTALVAQQKILQDEFTRRLNSANTAVTALRAANRDIAQREQLLRQEIDYVTTHYRPGSAAEPEPLPECIFTDGFVSVYNGAITSGDHGSTTVPAASPATGANAAASATATAETSADPLQPSDIQQRDILQHIAGYGSRCQSIEQQLNQLLDYLESINKGAAT